MAMALILYPVPDDIEALERHYHDIHLPLVKKIPGLQSIKISREPPRGLGTFRTCQLAIELYFPSVAVMEQAFQSPESLAAGADAATFAPPGRIRYTFEPERLFEA